MDAFKPHIEERLKTGVWNAVARRARSYDGTTRYSKIGCIRSSLSAQVSAMRRLRLRQANRRKRCWIGGTFSTKGCIFTRAPRTTEGESTPPHRRSNGKLLLRLRTSRRYPREVRETMDELRQKNEMHSHDLQNASTFTADERTLFSGQNSAEYTNLLDPAT